jgi:two-component system, OmpR family, sensor kinase
VRRLWRGTPLWLRLITAVLALAWLGLTLTGIFGARLLRGYLLDRVDEQLTAASRMLAAGPSVADLQPAGSYPSQFDFTGLDADGNVAVERRSIMSDSAPDVPRLSARETEKRAGDPFTVDAVRGGGSWRALAIPVRNGADDLVGSVVIATSLDQVDATVSRLVHIDLLVGALVLAGIAVAGFSLVRSALRPLDEIELTAAAIGRGDLGRRVPDNPPGTEMGRLSRALNAMLEQIERAFGARAASEGRARRSEERMRRFVADASHELRTPLTSIRGFAELHRQGAVTDAGEVSHLLARIEDEATRMGLLVDDLLLLARLDHERPLQHAAVDLREVVDAAAEAARATGPERRIDVDAPAAGDAGLVVTGDGPRLRQVVTNLLDNALAYSPPDAPVTLRLGSSERAGRDMVTLEVADRGPGLTADQAERVFERFYRTDAARSRARGGTGLGLSIVAAITHAHGGEVEVDSAPGEGATFRVLLPRPPSADAAEPPPPPPAAGAKLHA